MKGSPVKGKAPRNKEKSEPIKRKKATETTTANADVTTCDSMCEIFVEPQETPFLSSITENLDCIWVKYLKNVVKFTVISETRNGVSSNDVTA